MQSKTTIVTGAILLAATLAYLVGQQEHPATVKAVSAAPAPRSNAAPSFVVDPTNAFARTGQEYSWQPQVSDPDGDALQFSVANLPPWAAFDSATGKISGRPATTNMGTYEGVTVSVTDGRHPAVARNLTITVLGAADGVARLEWPGPISKVDGSVLDDLAGFRILYGRDPEELDHSVWIPDPQARSYSFATLEEGAWYFSIVAVNTSGLEGPATMPARKII